MRILFFALAVAVALTPSRAPAAQTPDPVGQDLTATIALHGMPCGKVVDSQRNADSDYTATCQDGSRYHVFVDSKGRVIVQKLAH
jgi:hypothetical protein